MATTTSQFQVKPDYFPSVQTCLVGEKQKTNTNPRYKFFKQTHFTAGDIDQFEEYRDATNGRLCIPDISFEHNIFHDIDVSEKVHWAKYQNIDATAVDNTFHYMFDKFKKGIFVKIKDGKMRVFLPFSKKNYINEWSKRIHIDPKYGDLNRFIQYVSTSEGYHFNPNSVNKYIDGWYANNCLVRYEYPIQEGDTNNPNARDMFRVLCEEREVPDMEFFVNRRDFPMIKTDNTEPYSHIYDTSQQPLLSHNYEKYVPILSMVTADKFADIPIPTGDDWARVTRREGKYFPHTCDRSFTMESIPWEKRKPTAVFRGGSTGCGVTIETNPRLKLSYLSKITPPDTDGIPLLDAGITEWNLRPRKLKGEKYLKTIETKSLPFGLSGRLTPQEQASYKYLINIDGHVSAYRLSLELESGTCILLVASKYRLWYRHMLKPFVHFVPVKADLSDLVEKIKWCKKHDTKCKEIAENAKKFAATYLTKDGILDYLQKLLFEIKKANGVYLYNSVPLSEIQRERELSILKENVFYPETTKTIKDLSVIPSQSRSYSLLHGIEWLINMTNIQGKFTEIAKKKEEIFNNQNTVIETYELAGYTVAHKTGHNPKGIIHETFIGTLGTNELLKQIPNFAYIFGMYENEKGTHMIMEYIKGQTLHHFIHSTEFNMEDYVFILLQLALTLHVAQRTRGLVHYDLTPWNIILQKLPEPVSFNYIIDHKTVYNITTRLVPIIIDMGRSHIIYDNQHYGVINMFGMSTVQDILTLLLTSVYDVTELKLARSAVRDIIIIANFLTGTKYHPKPFIETGMDGLGEVRFFFSRVKKYTEILTSEKYDLEAKTPFDLVQYLMKNLKYKMAIEIVNEIRNDQMNIGNARQVFDYVLCDNSVSRALTYAAVFHRVQQCDLPMPENVFLAYYTVQTLDDNLSSVFTLMMNFLAKTGIDSAKYVKKYEKTKKLIKEKYSPIFENKTENKIEYNIPELPRIEYNERMFLYPDKLLSLLKKIYNIPLPIDITQYKEIIEHTFLINSLYGIGSLRKFYMDNFAYLLEIDSLRIKTSIADIATFRTMAKAMSVKNLEYLEKDKEQCKKIKTVIDTLRDIEKYCSDKK